ncbi:MAG: MarR family winged helix-turn-helix transcriptional regulator [Pacificimonas sp.]
MSEGSEILKLDDFLPYRLSVVSNLVSRMIAQSYQGEGLKLAEWRVLAVLAETPAMSQREAAARTRMDKVAISRAAQMLTEKKLIARAANPDDGRSQLLRMTTAGQALYARVMPEAQALNREIWAAMPDGDAETLFAILARVEDAALAVAPE